MCTATRGRPAVVACLFLTVAGVGCNGTAAPDAKMSFFITSVGVGGGGNLGGFEGADAHCQRLAMNAGSTRTWHAYLSGRSRAGAVINARDRIGTGPWFNAKGTQVAVSVEDLHRDGLSPNNAMTERGVRVGSNVHDILTGSTTDGSTLDSTPDATCRGWTSNDAGRARVGHHDRRVGKEDSTSWNSNHLSDGCSPKALAGSLGAGLFYCFAVD
jgi:hypothetical protein